MKINSIVLALIFGWSVAQDSGTAPVVNSILVSSSETSFLSFFSTSLSIPGASNSPSISTAPEATSPSNNPTDIIPLSSEPTAPASETILPPSLTDPNEASPSATNDEHPPSSGATIPSSSIVYSSTPSSGIIVSSTETTLSGVASTSLSGSLAPTEGAASSTPSSESSTTSPSSTLLVTTTGKSLTITGTTNLSGQSPISTVYTTISGSVVPQTRSSTTTVTQTVTECCDNICSTSVITPVITPPVITTVPCEKCAVTTSTCGDCILTSYISTYTSISVVNEVTETTKTYTVYSQCVTYVTPTITKSAVPPPPSTAPDSAAETAVTSISCEEAECKSTVAQGDGTRSKTGILAIAFAIASLFF